MEWIAKQVIGKGSFGTVNLAVKKSDGSYFAVKSANKDSISSIQSLENEIELLPSLSTSSPYIIQYYGNSETGTHKYLHVEYLPRGDVSMMGPISDVDTIRSYTCCLLLALKQLQSRGIVHCDIKGSNLLVGPTWGTVKLSDFGSAVQVGESTDKIVPRGSPLWMAPEVVRSESQDFKSDIWSVGCTVIEMFKGMPAWRDCGPHTLFQIGYSDDLPEFPPSLPEPARDFLTRCLSRDPHQRWSCDQLLRHPFLLYPVPSSEITDLTPRCVLDLPTLDFDDDDDDDHHDDEIVTSARGRIGELVSDAGVGVNWESNGWVEVRNRVGGVDEGAELEFLDFFEGNTVISDPRVNLESEINYLSDGGGDVGYGSPCECKDEVEGNSIDDNNKIDNFYGGEIKRIGLFNLLLLLYLLYISNIIGGQNNVNNDTKIFFLHHMIYPSVFISGLMLQFCNIDDAHKKKKKKKKTDIR